jgi:glutamate--cysteine ligase
MSEFQAGDDPAARQPIAGVDDLIRYVASGAKPRSEWRVGTEYEKVGVLRESGLAAPFSGQRGIESVLERLADRYGWQPKRERGRIIALTGRDANITVEPGGQLELSGEQCASIHCAHQELMEHVKEVVTVGAELGIVFLGLGIQPVSQANFDFGDERDAMQKFRVAMGLAPLISAMFANSSISENRFNGFMTMRGHIWTDTDNARSGMLPFAFSPDAGIEDYVQYALDVPMYFIIRNGDYVETHVTFRQFMTEGWGAERATIDDWALHLTTLFPEVRLKRYLEVRSADSQPPEMMLALPALLKGILYEPDAMEGAWDLVRSWNWDERIALYRDAHREGLHARIRRIRLAELARELVEIGAAGLRRQDQRNDRGDDERIYLHSMEELVRDGNSLGRRLAELWEGPWNRDVTKLIEHTTYRLPS